MFLNIIFLIISLWSGLTFSSSNRTKTLTLPDSQTPSQAVSSFNDQIKFIDQTLKLRESFLNPVKKCDNQELSKEVQTWVREYMPRFYDKETAFEHIHSLIQEASEQNPEMKSKYETLQAIEWTKTDITYEQLRTNLSQLVSFYQTYSVAITGEQLFKAENPIISTPSKSTQPPSNQSNPKNQEFKSYFIRFIQWRKQLASCISKIILNIKSIVNRFNPFYR